MAGELGESVMLPTTGGAVDDDGRTLPGAATMVGKGRRRGVGRMTSLVLVLDLVGAVGWIDASTGSRLDGRTIGVQSLLTRLLSSNVGVAEDGGMLDKMAGSSSATSSVSKIRALKSVPLVTVLVTVVVRTVVDLVGVTGLAVLLLVVVVMGKSVVMAIDSVVGNSGNSVCSGASSAPPTSGVNSVSNSNFLNFRS